MNYMLKT